MAPKTTKKARTKMPYDKSIPQQGESSRGVKRTCQAIPVSPPSKKSKKKQGVAVADQFDSKKFINLQAARLLKALGRVRISNSEVFDFCSLHECGL